MPPSMRAYLGALLCILCVIWLPALAIEPVEELESNIVIQWSNNIGLGVGPHALGGYPLPPTPVGVYDDVAVLPLDGTKYWHATNGKWSVSVVRKGNKSHWFVFGTFCQDATPGASCARYANPTNITSLVFNALPLLVNNPLLKLALSQYVIQAAALEGASVASPGDSSTEMQLNGPYSLSLYSWSPANAPNGDSALGRTVTSANRVVPTLVRTLALTGNSMAEAAISAHLDCGRAWCAVSNSTILHYWAASNILPSTSASINIDGGLKRLVAFPDAFLTQSKTNAFIAYGRNTKSRFGSTANPSAIGTYTLGPMQNLNVTSMACGMWHCLTLVGTDKILPFGDNTFSQLARDVKEVTSITLSSPIPESHYMDIPQAFGGTIFSVGAVGATSFVLSGTGLWAWGLNIPLGATSDPSHSSFGAPVVWTNSALPFAVNIPKGFTPSRRLPSVNALVNVEDPYSLSFPMRVNQPTFDGIRQNRNGLSTKWDPVQPDIAATQLVLAWGSALPPPGLSDPTWNGVPLGNRSIVDGAWFAPSPTIVELPTTFTNWTSVSCTMRTVYATGFPSALFDANHDTPRMFTWGALQSEDRGNPLLPFPRTRGQAEILPAAYLPSLVDTTDIGYAMTASAKLFGCAIDVAKKDSLGTITVDCYGENLSGNSNDRQHSFAVPTPINAVLTCGASHCAILPSKGVSNSVSMFAAVLTAAEAKWMCRNAGAHYRWTSMFTPNGLNGPINDMSLGDAFSIFVINDNSVRGCGVSDEGQLGQVSSPPTNAQDIGTALAPIISIASGRAHTLALTSSGVIHSFGNNRLGQLGRANFSDNSWGTVQGLPHPNFKSVACVYDTSFAITTDGALYAWGQNDFANLFGDPLLSAVPLNHQPQLVDIPRGVGIEKLIVESISSSSFSRSVFAIASINPASMPSHPVRDTVAPTDPNYLKMFKFGADPLGQGLLSPTLPGLYSRHSAVLPFVFRKFEYLSKVVTASGVTWMITNQSRLFVMSAIANLSVGPSRPPATTNSHLADHAPSPRYVFEWTDGILDVGATEIGAVVLLSTGKVFWVSTLSPTLEPTAIMAPNTFVNMTCNPTSCALVTSTNTLMLMRTWDNFGTPAYTVPNIASPSQVALTASPITLDTCKGRLLYKMPTQWVFRADSGSTCEVTGEVSAADPLTSVSGGGSHFLALTANGHIFGLGNSDKNQLPSAKATQLRVGWTEIFPGAVQCGFTLKDVIATSRTSFVRCDNGEVYGWGALSLGQVKPQSLDLAGADWSTLTAVKTPVRVDFGDLPATMTLAGIAGDAVQDVWQETDADRPSWMSGEATTFFAWMLPAWVPTPQDPVPPPPTDPTDPNPDPTDPTPVDPTPTPVDPTPTPIDTGCSTQPPNSAPGWTCNAVTRTWVHIGTLSVNSSTPLVVTSAIQVDGNLTIETGSTVTFQISDATHGAPLVNVSGCVTIDSTLVIQPDTKFVKSLPSKQGSDIAILEASCSFQAQSNLLRTGDNNKGCKKYKVVPLEQYNKETGRHTLLAVLSVSSDKCNLWWIIVASVVGGILVIAVIILLIIFLTPLSRTVMPYKGLRTVSRPSGSQRSQDTRSAEMHA